MANETDYFAPQKKEPTGIHCPSCDSVLLKTLETRRQHASKRRRKLCVKCNHRFTTIEHVLVDE